MVESCSAFTSVSSWFARSSAVLAQIFSESVNALNWWLVHEPDSPHTTPSKGLSQPEARVGREIEARVGRVVRVDSPQTTVLLD